MSQNKRIIFSMLMLIIVSFSLTYLISLNITSKIFDLPWLSNNLLFAVFGGVFSSALVTLFCDLHRYFLNKKSCEDYLFDHIVKLYSNLLIMHNNLNWILTNPNEKIFSNPLYKLSQDSISLLQVIKVCDYSTFDKKNKAYNKLMEFKNYAKELDAILIENNYLEIAINTVKINQVSSGNFGDVICGETSIKDVVHIYYKRLEKPIEMCNSLLITLDYSGRYNYLENSKNLSLQEFNLKRDYSLDSYIKKYKNNSSE